MILIRAIAFMALACLGARGADWYLDSAASGSNSGTSWANAWVDPTNVVWGASGVKAGDSLWISGSSTGKLYGSILTLGASGTNGARISIRAARDVGHIGNAILPAISINSRTNITIDGSRSDSFTNATSVLDLHSDTNNIGLHCSRTNGTGVFISDGRDLTIRFLGVGPIGTTNSIGDYPGIQMQNLNVLTNVLIERTWIHDIQNDGIQLNSVTTQPTTWDAFMVDHSIVERTGDDGIQTVRNGTTISHSMLIDHWIGLYNGHPDQLQLSGVSQKYIKIVNNLIRNKANSLMICEFLVNEGDVLGPILVAGNIFYTERDWYYVDIQDYGISFDAWRANGGTSVLSASLSDFYFVNNTMYHQSSNPFRISRATPEDITDPTSGGTRSVWQYYITNSMVAGNLFIDCKYNSSASSAVSMPWTGAPGSATNGVMYGTNDLLVVSNTVAGYNRTMSYYGTAGTADIHGRGNSTNMPLIETNLYTLVLDPTDTVARDTAPTLSSITNTFPELLIDLKGTARGYNGAWDRGALEYAPTRGRITNGLLVGIDFNTPPANDDAGYDDWSGNTNHALHLGYMNAHTVSNRCPDQFTWTHPITGNTETGVVFVPYQDGWEVYDDSGDYLAITNTPATNPLWVMPEATFCFWGMYDPLPSPVNTNWLAGGSRRFLSGGYGYDGAWAIGLLADGDPKTGFNIYTNNSAAAEIATRWADRVNTSNGQATTGSSTNMKHYVATWNRGVITVYLNGVQGNTRSLTDETGAVLTNLTIRGPSGQRNGFLGIGVDTHNGKGILTYTNEAGVLLGDDGDGTMYEVTGAKQLPNNGWMRGRMDDVRIYNRVLSTNEIWQIFTDTETGGGSSGGGEEGGGGGGASGFHRLDVQRVNAGQIIVAP